MSDYQEGHLATTCSPSLASFKLCLPISPSKKPPFLDTITLERFLFCTPALQRSRFCWVYLPSHMNVSLPNQ